MDNVARQTDGTLDDSNTPHPASTEPASKAVKDRVRSSVRRMHPNVDRRRPSSFPENATSSNLHTLVDLALSAIGDGTIELQEPSSDTGSSKRKYTADHETAGADDPESHGESSAKRIKVDYGSRSRPQNGGPDYVQLAVNQLHEDFSYVEEVFIRAVFTSLNSLYAPTHLFLLAKQKEVLRRSNMSAVPHLSVAAKPAQQKGKGRALEDAEFERERKWLIKELGQQEIYYYLGTKAEDETSGTQADVEADDGRMIECGCCFAEYPSNDVSTCPNKHMFCHSCISSHCSNLLLVQKTNIKCMSTEECESSFSATALRRSLSEQQFNLWERLDQRREIAAAGLILEDCPFCEFACEIEDDQATTFVCGNAEQCGKESCRGCKKLNHLPKTCQEVRDDEAREGRHSIAEAMTRALMRNCPRCEKPFIKDDGCNKITCPFCQTVSCYLCRQIITGYDHFNTSPTGQRRRDGKCLLFDAVAERHNDDVIQAAANALEQVKSQLPHMNENELRVELPPPPRQIPSPRLIWPLRRRAVIHNNGVNPGVPQYPFDPFQFQHVIQRMQVIPQFGPPPLGPAMMQDRRNAPQFGFAVAQPPPLYQNLQARIQAEQHFRNHPLLRVPQAGHVAAPAPPWGFAPIPGPLLFRPVDEAIYHPPYVHVPLPPAPPAPAPQFVHQPFVQPMPHHHHIHHNHYHLHQPVSPEAVVAPPLPPASLSPPPAYQVIGMDAPPPEPRPLAPIAMPIGPPLLPPDQFRGPHPFGNPVHVQPFPPRPTPVVQHNFQGGHLFSVPRFAFQHVYPNMALMNQLVPHIDQARPQPHAHIHYPGQHPAPMPGAVVQLNQLHVPQHEAVMRQLAAQQEQHRQAMQEMQRMLNEGRIA